MAKRALEIKYQNRILRKLEDMFPGCVVFNLTPLKILGLPDTLILYENRWAALETKRFSSSRVQPLQTHYVRLFHRMSFASFIYPENEEEVLNALQRSLKT